MAGGEAAHLVFRPDLDAVCCVVLPLDVQAGARSVQPMDGLAHFAAGGRRGQGGVRGGGGRGGRRARQERRALLLGGEPHLGGHHLHALPRAHGRQVRLGCGCAWTNVPHEEVWGEPTASKTHSVFPIDLRLPAPRFDLIVRPRLADEFSN